MTAALDLIVPYQPGQPLAQDAARARWLPLAAMTGKVARVCVSVDQAEFSGTILYAGRRWHPQHGLVEVLGYQNTAVNLAGGPNAMLLHAPAACMSQEHFISIGRSADVLIRMRDAAARAQPVAASADIAWMGADAAVEVFDHDIYTVVLASDPTQIPAALHHVPPYKRPPLNPVLFEFYADAFPGYTIALCCFDNAQALRAKPLLMWYPPTTPIGSSYPHWTVTPARFPTLTLSSDQTTGCCSLAMTRRRAGGSRSAIPQISGTSYASSCRTRSRVPSSPTAIYAMATSPSPTTPCYAET